MWNAENNKMIACRSIFSAQNGRGMWLLRTHTIKCSGVVCLYTFNHIIILDIFVLIRMPCTTNWAAIFVNHVIWCQFPFSFYCYSILMIQAVFNTFIDTHLSKCWILLVKWSYGYWNAENVSHSDRLLRLSNQWEISKVALKWIWRVARLNLNRRNMSSSRLSPYRHEIIVAVCSWILHLLYLTPTQRQWPLRFNRME